MNNTIIKENQYINDIDENGKPILKIYDPEFKMWAILRFKDQSDPKLLEEIAQLGTDIYYKN